MRTLRKRWQRRVAGFLLVYGVAAMAIAGCADRLILFPSHDRIAVAGQVRVQVSSDRGPLEVWAQRTAAAAGQEPQAIVLQFVGNASRGEYEADDTARQWARLPAEIWGVNYPGYGGSAGEAQLKAIAPAALAVFDAASRAAHGRPVFVSGNSIGTAAALHVAAHRPVAGLVLKNPPPLRQLLLGHYGWWNLWLAAGPFSFMIPRELDSLANAKQVQAPGVFLLAGNDTTVPPRFQQKVVDAFAGPKRLVRLANAEHNSMVEGTSLDQLQAELDWLWAQSARSPH